MPTPCDSVIRVTLDGKTDAFPVNTTVQTVISRLLDAPAAAAVLGVMQGGVCRELNESLTKDCELTSLTYRDEEGRRIYERSLRFLMLAATLRHLDQMYMDRLNGLLSEEDFQRIYQKVKMDRTVLENRLKSLQEQAKQPVNTEEKAKALVKQFLDSALTSRELLVSLIERVELTEEKEIIIKFRFHELEAIS